MNMALPKLAGFAGALALLFGGGALAGGLTNPSPPGGKAAAKDAGMDGMAEAAMGPRGLGVAENGLRLVVDSKTFTRGRTQQLRFRIVGDDGGTIRDFDVEHTKRMHLIVVRRDMTGFQHLHPVEAADGTWSTPLQLDAGGSYRVFADFSHKDKKTTLASDLTVDGAFAAQPLPQPQLTAQADGGYSVELDPVRPQAGEEATLRFRVIRNGRPIAVQPYLGANGHLVALRDGDLAYLHVHPGEAPAATTAREGIDFDADFPTTGRYRLFLQFKVDGRVHTAAFTQEVK